MNGQNLHEESSELKKAEVFYGLSRELYQQELDRSAVIENKASKFFSVITIILGGFGFFSRSVFNTFIPPNSELELLMIVLIALLFLSVIASWFYLFSVLRVSRWERVNIEPDYFEKNELGDIYIGHAKAITNSMYSNVKNNEEKAASLQRAYKLMKISIIILILTALIYGIQLGKSEYKTPKGAISMTDENQDSGNGKETKPESGDGGQSKPNWDVTPPSTGYVANKDNDDGHKTRKK